MVYQITVLLSKLYFLFIHLINHLQLCSTSSVLLTECAKLEMRTYKTRNCFIVSQQQSEIIFCSLLKKPKGSLQLWSNNIVFMKFCRWNCFLFLLLLDMVSTCFSNQGCLFRFGVKWSICILSPVIRQWMSEYLSSSNDTGAWNTFESC